MSQQTTMDDNSEYELVTIKWQPRTFYPPTYQPTRPARVPSDVANSEFSEKASGDPARNTSLDIDYPSDEADNGDAPELEIRPTTTTIDSSCDTSLDQVIISTTVHNPPCNEILYLQVLLNRETRIVRKPGILPLVCYVDSSTSTRTSDVSKEQAPAKGEIEETLEDLMKRLDTEHREKRGPRIRGNNTDDFFMEG